MDKTFILNDIVISKKNIMLLATHRTENKGYLLKIADVNVSENEALIREYSSLEEMLWEISDIILRDMSIEIGEEVEIDDSKFPKKYKVENLKGIVQISKSYAPIIGKELIGYTFTPITIDRNYIEDNLPTIDSIGSGIELS